MQITFIINRTDIDLATQTISYAADAAEERDAGTPLEGVTGYATDAVLEEHGFMPGISVGYAGVRSLLIAGYRRGHSAPRIMFIGRTAAFEAAVRGDDDFGGLATLLDSIEMTPETYYGEAYGLLRDMAQSWNDEKIAGLAIDRARAGRLHTLARREWAARILTGASRMEPAGIFKARRLWKTEFSQAARMALAGVLNTTVEEFEKDLFAD